MTIDKLLDELADLLDELTDLPLCPECYEKVYKVIQAAKEKDGTRQD